MCASVGCCGSAHTDTGVCAGTGRSVFFFFFFFLFFLHKGKFIISFACNDVAPIKIFIGFHKIISYTTFPGDPDG